MVVWILGTVHAFVTSIGWRHPQQVCIHVAIAYRCQLIFCSAQVLCVSVLVVAASEVLCSLLAADRTSVSLLTLQRWLSATAGEVTDQYISLSAASADRNATLS